MYLYKGLISDYNIAVLEKCKKHRKIHGKVRYSDPCDKQSAETIGLLPKTWEAGRFFTGCHALFFRMEKEN